MRQDLYNPGDTIVAIATPPGQGALGVIRLSGPLAIPIAQTACRWLGDNPEGNRIRYGTFREPGGAVLDEVVALVFRAPRSYTREEVVELSFHGSPYVLSRAVHLLVQAGARLAEPGEFTLRAFRHGAMDLSQAEAVADLIAAHTEQAQQVAIRQLRGGIGNQLQGLRQQLIDFAALVELELDFSEEDVEFAQRNQLQALIAEAKTVLRRLIESFAAGNALKHGFPTAIVGRPNAGKSTLLNRLVGEQRAIVSEIPGTTRDVVEDQLVLGGYPFRLMDTAGLRDTDDPVEAEGVRRSRARIAQAEFVLLLVDASDTQPAQAQTYVTELAIPGGTELICLANKTDQLTPEDVEAWAAIGFLPLSAETGTGVPVLTERLVGLAKQRTNYDTIVTSQRHVDALSQALASLEAVEINLNHGLSGDLLALDLRLALQALGAITGEITSDDILGAIFSRFCIGK